MPRAGGHGKARTCAASLLGASLLALALPGTCMAQAEPTSVSDLDSLVAVALRDSPRIAALEAAHRSALERIPQAAALPDPMLNYIAEGAPLKNPSPTEAMAHRIGISQMLPFPGKPGLMRRMMSAEADMAQAELDRGRLEIAAEMHAAFYDLYLLFATSEVLEQSRSELQALADVAHTRYTVGTAVQADLLKANLELARETSELAVARAQIPAALARLNALLGHAPDAPLDRPALRDTACVVPDLPTLEGGALERQPMWRMTASAVERGESALRLARKSAWPDFTIGVEYMANREMPDTWTGMFGVTLPIWRWNKVAPARREAEAMLASAQAERAQARQNTLAMVREAYAMLAAERTMLNLTRDSVLPQAELGLASTRVAYETGRHDFMSLIDAQRSLLQARLERERAAAGYLKARAALGLAAGDMTLLGVKHE